MKKRVVFSSKGDRDLFFKKIIEQGPFSSWKELYLSCKVPRKTFDVYRNGRSSLPEDLFKSFLLKMTKEDRQYFKKKILVLADNWGVVKGGLSTHKKHKWIFEQGRKKAHEVKKIEKKKFDIGLPLSPELSYFIGLFIGDGFTNKYGGSYLTQFTGDKNKETSYYEKIVSNISKTLFDLSPNIRGEKRSNTLRVNFYSKSLYRLITKRFKIPAGRKTYDVLIPKEILDSSREIILACVAGIYDAEGSLYFDKRLKYKKEYPVIGLNMNNKGLLKQLSNIFDKNQIPYSPSGDFSKLYTYGHINVRKFLRKVKLLNMKYPDRFRKIDYCPGN